MNTINKLGVRMAVITIGIFIVIFALWKGAAAVLTNALKTAPQATPTPILSEIVFTPAPATTLPPQLQQEISSYKESTEELLGVYTKKYLATLPPDADRSQVLDQKTLEKFIEDNKGILLPELPKGTVKISATSGKTAIKNYLDKISPAQNKDLQTVTGDMITAAMQKQLSDQDVHALTPIRASIVKNFELFKLIEVPKEALVLHTKLLQATMSMANNVSLLESMQKDFIGGLIGQKNLADLHPVFTDIGTQILALETKYKIK